MGAKLIKSTSINNKEWYASQTAWHALHLNKHEYIISLQYNSTEKTQSKFFCKLGKKENEHCSSYIWAFHYLLGITELTDSYTEI
jgi:hypothetical protein